MGQFYHMYKYCGKCGEWKPKKLIRCPDCNMRLRESGRQQVAKKPTKIDPPKRQMELTTSIPVTVKTWNPVDTYWGFVTNNYLKQDKRSEL